MEHRRLPRLPKTACIIAFMYGKKKAILSASSLFLDHDQDYDSLKSGQWRFPPPYLAIHRFAVRSDHHAQGIATRILETVDQIARERKIMTIRVDTHELNLPMISVLTKNGFSRCGEVLIEKTKPRIAFDKRI